MDYLIIPLQEKLEEWKKTVLNLDKDHARGEYHPTTNKYNNPKSKFPNCKQLKF